MLNKELHIDLEMSRIWAIKRLKHFIEKLESAPTALAAEAALYTIKTTAEQSFRTFNVKNHESLGCDRGLMPGCKCGKVLGPLAHLENCKLLGVRS